MNASRKAGLLCALAALFVLPGAAEARSLTEVNVTGCSISDSVTGGSASFEGRMRSVAGARRMWMRFRLQERFGTREFESVKVPDLVAWRKSQAGVKVFSYTQKVKGLELGGLYRMRVDFRWYDAGGKLLRRARRNSSSCGRAGPLANLRVVTVRARSGQAAGTVDYFVDVVNTGQLAAQNVALSLTVDGATLDVREASELLPGEVETLRFSGPPCSRRLRTDVDPRDSIHESNEDDNRRVRRCPPVLQG